MVMTISTSKAEIGVRRRKAKILQRVRNSTPQYSKILTAMNTSRVQHRGEFQPPALREMNQTTSPKGKRRRRHQKSKLESREPNHKILPKPHRNKRIPRCRPKQRIS